MAECDRCARMRQIVPLWMRICLCDKGLGVAPGLPKACA